MRGPGREAVARCADAFFRRSQEADWNGMLALAAPGMTAWMSGGRPRTLFSEAVSNFATMRERMGPWEYLDVQRLVSDDGFCEQHTVRFRRPDGTAREFSACVVARVGPDGLLLSLDEYLDPATESTWQS